VTGKLPDTKSQKVSTGTWVLFAILGALLFASIVGFWLALKHGVMPHISVHGWIAMSIGVVFSLIIGCGLMWLSFYSAREGFDDRADPGRLAPKSERNQD
jgi:protein-S-isoprenylcysteine O-methyltransferase Ste14